MQTLLIDARLPRGSTIDLHMLHVCACMRACVCVCVRSITVEGEASTSSTSIPSIPIIANISSVLGSIRNICICLVTRCKISIPNEIETPARFTGYSDLDLWQLESVL